MFASLVTLLPSSGRNFEWKFNNHRVVRVRILNHQFFLLTQLARIMIKGHKLINYNVKTINLIIFMRKNWISLSFSANFLDTHLAWKADDDTNILTCKRDIFLRINFRKKLICTHIIGSSPKYKIRGLHCYYY